MLVLHYCLHRKPGMSRDDFYEYWKGPHAEMVRKFAKKIGVIHYVQHHGTAPEMALAMQDSRGLSDPFDGIAELGFESLESLEKGSLDPSVVEARAILQEDEAKFIDFSRSVILFTSAHTVIAS